MKMFYIETDKLTQVIRLLRFVYTENETGDVNFTKMIDPNTGEELTVEELKKIISPDALLNISTAHYGTYQRVYF